MNTNQQTIIQTQKLLTRVLDYYRNTFKRAGGVQEQLVKRLGITDFDIFEQHKMGYCDGTLSKTIPTQGQAVDLLKSAGILNADGVEVNTGCLVVPVFGNDGACVKLLSVKFTDAFGVIDFETFLESGSNATSEACPPKIIKEEAQQTKDGLTVRFNNRSYLIRGLEQATAKKLRVNIKITCDRRFYLDSFDLCSAKHRKIFAKEAAAIFHQPLPTVEQDLLKIITLLEANIQDKSNEDKAIPVMTNKERNEALKFLKSPDLIKKILADFEVLGLCGENTNKLIGYLAAVSRKLDDPLSLLILSRSSAGKSTLQDAVLELVPQEDKIKYTRITGNALFYTQQGALDHKIIAIEEEEGAQDAAYSIRIMQSAKSLTSATTIKDPLTGEMKTKEYHTKINSALMYTTTNGSIDYETMSRFIIATIDESKQQTQAIHAVQRKKDTLEGLLKDTAKDQVIKKHYNAQRLLRPLKVVNPYAPYLTFVDGRIRARRDNKKYLGMIKAIAFLHQYQRPIKTIEQNKKPIEYIEVDLNDIVFANSLANEVLGRSLDELSPQARNLLTMLKKMKQEAQGKGISRAQVSRRDIRVFTGWSDHQVRDHLQQLIDLEYVAIVAGKNGYRFLYELIYDGGGEDGNKFMMGLVDIKTLKERMNTRLPCG